MAERCSAVRYPAFFLQLYIGNSSSSFSIYLSRVTFAKMLAPAIDADFESLEDSYRSLDSLKEKASIVLQAMGHDKEYSDNTGKEFAYIVMDLFLLHVSRMLGGHNYGIKSYRVVISKYILPASLVSFRIMNDSRMGRNGLPGAFYIFKSHLIKSIRTSACRSAHHLVRH